MQFAKYVKSPLLTRSYITTCHLFRYKQFSNLTPLAVVDAKCNLYKGFHTNLCNNALPFPKMNDQELEHPSIDVSMNMNVDVNEEKIEPLNQPLVWIDLETTGLQVNKESILEIAVILTDGSLDTLIEGPDLVIHKDRKTLAQMDHWCLNQHGSTGLIQACLQSKITTQEAEQEVLKFIKKYVPDKNVGLLSGSSVHFDKEFLRKEMPSVYEHLHYRIVDVTSVGELVRRWFPTVLRRRPRKQGNHRALDDIRDSIRELQFYKDNVFRMR